MKIEYLKLTSVILAASAFVLTAPASRAQSAYSNAVMSLDPVGYWPLQETAQPPTPDIETNYGSLGAVADGYYASTNVQHAQLGPIAGSGADTSVNFLGNSSGFMIVPTTDNRVSLPPGQPFTVECWARATGNQSFVAMINQTGPNNAGGLNAATNSSGWSLCQNFAPYRGTSSPNGPACFTFHVFNGTSFVGGAEMDLTNANPNMWLTGGATGYVNSWVYLCGVFDGTNCWLYMFSTNLNSAYEGTNAMVFQLPITTGTGVPYFGSGGTTIPNAAFSPDTWDPIMFGCTRGYGANPYHGSVGEVAIYTNALTFNQITNDFEAGTNGLGIYDATIVSNNPYMYWKMNAPLYAPAAASYPVAADYGSAALSMTNLNTTSNGVIAAVYQPGTVPGVAGPQYAGFGSMTNACAFNGIRGAVDVGYNHLLDPTGVTNNFSVVAWFRGNPMDSGGRYNCVAGHSSSSWAIQVQNGTIEGNKGTGSTANVAPATYNINDGKWHMCSVVYNCNNGVATNLTVYLDNGIVSSTVANTGTLAGQPALDVLIGDNGSDVNTVNDTNYNSAQQYFAGRIAHVAFFTNALSLSQIQGLFFTGEPSKPVILTQPVSAALNQNASFTNTILAAGSPPDFLQWYDNGVAIAGATNSSLIFNPVLPGDASTNYYVIITNFEGAVTSSVVSLTVYSNVTFAAQFPITFTSPLILYGGTNNDGTNYFGSTPTFSVSANGAPPFAYQWTTNGVAVGGATNADFTFTNCQFTGPTNFACVVANIYGPATNAWLVSYLPAPTAPFPQAVLAGQPVGYWRLNEPDDGNYDGNDGAICHDYESGNDGIYTNVYLSNFTVGNGYSAETDPTEKAAEFGIYTSPASDANSIGTNIDFSGSSNAEITVALWANGLNIAQPGDAGLVAKGLFSGEEFVMDEGGTGSALRFGVRTAAGTFYGASGSFNLGSDSNWHFVAGVCDEANSNLSLYVDGQLVASTFIPTNSGLITSSTTVPMMIGARSSVATAPGNEQFKGLLNDAAIYNYAMTATQVLAEFEISGQAPYFTQEPSGTNADYDGTLTIPAAAGGSQPLAYRWYDVGAGGYIPGQTNATLVVSNIIASDSYYLTVSNAFGSTNSATVTASVQTGGPSIETQPRSSVNTTVGGAVSFSVAAYGTAPLYYQWQFFNGSSWVNLADNGRIVGSESYLFAITNVYGSDGGNYQVVVANSFGSVTSSVATVNIIGVLPVDFETGLSWTANGAASFANGLLTLTTDPPSSDGTASYFFKVPQYVGAFKAFFTYQAQAYDTFPLADGITFCLQDDPRGATAMGLGGGDLGVLGSTPASPPVSGNTITPSVELELNIYPSSVVGYSFDEDGGIGPNTAPGNVNLTNGPVDVSILYVNGQMALTLSNELTAATYNTSLNVGNITQALGTNTALVGFTGSYGGDHSIQTITNFTFVSIPTMSVQLNSGNNQAISWPGSIVGYTLQESSNLTTGTWLNVTNQAILTNGQNEVITPQNGNDQFYRLVLP